MNDFIEIKGARVHNLKNVSLKIPRNKFIVVTGVSGSGKSSLAFDTLYAEGQRRYVESLSAYARQFLDRMDKPDVDSITGISPALAIEQRTLGKNPRSTVGTVTEIYDYLRLLYGRVGKTICRNCGTPVRKDIPASVVNAIMKWPAGTKLILLFEKVVNEQTLLELSEKGFTRIYDAGDIYEINDAEAMKRIFKKKSIHIIADRLILKASEKSRLADSVESAFKQGDGRIIVKIVDGEEFLFSNRFECNTCGTAYQEADPKLFSFNNPYGACPACQGFGNKIELDLDLVIPDKSKTLRQGAIKPWTTDGYADFQERLEKNAKKLGIPLHVPVMDLTREQYNAVLNGGPGFEGIRPFFAWLEKKTYKMHVRVLLSKYRGYVMCSDCNGSRLQPDANCVQVDGKTVQEISTMSVNEALQFFENINLSTMDFDVARRALEEIKKRFNYLKNVGLEYLTCNRMAGSLSGGEAQRISLATSLGSALVGSLYILDEPSIGLHPRDNQKLIGILKNLQTIGNTVLVVEHDQEMMESCHQIIDMGPKAGVFGGEVIYQGSYDDILKDSKSLTGQYLSGKKVIPMPKGRRKGNGKSITIMHAAENNLKKIDVNFPLGMFVGVTGVSGSGKSTLIHDILYAGLMRQKGLWSSKIGLHQKIIGAEHIDHVEMVDQQPIGRTPRSNPATYIKLFDIIRDVYASTPLAKLRGYTSGTFSFNVPGGRCETCEGAGQTLVEMQFLADVYLECEECKGKRYKKEILEAEYKGKSIYVVLETSVREALDFFAAFPKIIKKLQVLDDVGLGYLKLGQSGSTLSGGEAQRVKLAAHLADRTQEKTLYIMDEPTTGLHFDDIDKLLMAFNQLIEAGHSLIVIEHNMDVVKCADWIIDLGPEGGDGGGMLVAQGTPEMLVQDKKSYTGKYLSKYIA